MSTLGDIREALRLALASATTDVNIYDYATDTVAGPAVVIYRPERVFFAETQSSTKRYVIPVQLLVARVDARAADDELDELMDFVVDTLDADPNLSGMVDSVSVSHAEEFGTVQSDDGVTYLACNLRVDVLV